MRLRMRESVRLEHTPDQFGVACKNLVEELRSIETHCARAIVQAGRRICQELVPADGSEVQEKVVLRDPVLTNVSARHV